MVLGRYYTVVLSKPSHTEELQSFVCKGHNDQVSKVVERQLHKVNVIIKLFLQVKYCIVIGSIN